MTNESLKDRLKRVKENLSQTSKESFRFSFSPPEMRTAEACMAAVNANAHAHLVGLFEQSTKENCMAAVHKNGCAFEQIPDEQRTPEVVMAAVRSSGSALLFVAPEQRQESWSIPRAGKSFHPIA